MSFDVEFGPYDNLNIVALTPDLDVGKCSKRKTRSYKLCGSVLGVGVLTAVLLKVQVFWDVALHGLVCSSDVWKDRNAVETM
jgi:hypothetical protein